MIVDFQAVDRLHGKCGRGGMERVLLCNPLLRFVVGQLFFLPSGLLRWNGCRNAYEGCNHLSRLHEGICHSLTTKTGSSTLQGKFL